MKSNRVTGTPNQVPSTDEIRPDLNHSGIYNTQNMQKTLNVRIYILNRAVQECQIRNKVNKEDKGRITQASISRKLKQIDVCCSLLDGKRHQSLEEARQNLFLNDPKQTEPNKTKTRCRHDAHQYM